MIYAKETWSDIANDAIDLMLLHYSEVLGEGVVPDIDLQKLEAVDRAGVLRVYTARDKDRLVGYAGFVVMNSLINKSEVEAEELGVFIHANYRSGWCAYRLMAYADSDLLSQGVNVINYHAPEGGDAFVAILERRGYIKVETKYSRRSTWH